MFIESVAKAHCDIACAIQFAAVVSSEVKPDGILCSTEPQFPPAETGATCEELVAAAPPVTFRLSVVEEVCGSGCGTCSVEEVATGS